MTQKELLYLEDGIKHEKNIIDVLSFMSECLNEDELIKFSEKELKNIRET